MSSESIRQSILLVHNVPLEVRQLYEGLRADYTVLFATGGPDALHLARSRAPDLILLSESMPGMDGFAVCERLKSRPDTRAIPVIFMTTASEAADEARGLSLGAVDYISNITNPLRMPIVIARLRNHMERRRSEHLLLRERAFLAAVLETSGLFVIVTDAEGTLLHINPACEQFSGITPETARGQPVWEQLCLSTTNNSRPSPDRNPMADFFSHNTLRDTQFERECSDRDSAHHLITWQLTRIIAPTAGAPEFVVITGTDISDLRQAEEKEIRAIQSRLAISALLETSLEPLPLSRQLEIALDIILFIPWLAVEFTGAIFLMNNETQKLDLTAHRDLPMPLRTACLEISLGQCLCGLAGLQRKIVYRHCLDDAHVIGYDGMPPHGHYCVPILSRNQVLGVLNLYVPHGHQRMPEEDALLTTITTTLAGIIDHRRLEQALHAERDFVSTVLGTTSALVTVLDPQGRFILFNKACEKLTGHSAQALKGQYYLWDCLLDQGEIPQVQNHISQLVAGFSPARDEHHWLTKTREKRLISWVSTTLTNEDDSVKNIISTGIDITEQRQAEKQLQHVARKDPLTGLPNRLMFHEYLLQTIAQAKRHGFCFALLFLDLDHFKAVNDSLGHEAGDQLLIEAAQRIRHALRETDLVARLGGDEFVVILGGNACQEIAKSVAGKIVETLQKNFSISDKQCYIGTSIGISNYPEQGDDPDLLLKKADQAMSAVKKGGRNHFLVYDPSMAEIPSTPTAS